MLLWPVFFAMFLLCAGISMIFLVYICITWYASYVTQPTNFNSNPNPNPPHKASNKGLSPSELEMLPGVLEDGGGITGGVECTVCLDDIEEGQPARILPECRHVFHRGCADAWLSANAACPLCRTRLPPPGADQPAPPPPPPPGIDAV